MSDNPIQSAERLFHVLELLAQNDSMNLTDISSTLELHKSTVHRLLKSLIHLGYVSQDPASTQYSLTYKIIALSNSCYSNNRIVKLVHPYLEALCHECHETVHFVEKISNHIIYLDKVQSMEYTYQMYSRIGALNEIYCCATGKCFLSQLPDQEIRELWPILNPTARTPYTILDLDDYINEIHNIRENGFAHDRQETELGLYSIGTAIQSDTNTPCYAISITSPISRVTEYTIEHNIHLIMQAASEISKVLGGK